MSKIKTSKLSMATRLLILTLLTFSILLGSFAIVNNSIGASASNEVEHINHANLARDFISFQHTSRGVEYENIEVYATVNLYDELHSIVGVAVIIYRDGELDYVVMNLITYEIDEWGINEQYMVSRFKSGERIYYGGALTFSTRDGNEFVDFNGTRHDRARFERRSREFRETARGRRNARERERTITASSPPANGMLNWSQILANHGSHNLVEFRYVSGITWNGVSGNGLVFTPQSTLNLNYRIRHGVNRSMTCGPTMVVNMLIYFQWRGFDRALINGSIHDTFERALHLSGWNNGTFFSRDRDALRTILRQQGYNYTMNTYGGNFNNFANSIRQGRPVLMEMHHGNWGHGVVVVGFEHFSHTYQTGIWPFRRYVTRNFHFLRVIDGTAYSNSSRFVDFNGIFTGINGACFWIH
ncbi:MAG: hypothetical protein FWC11_05775 [Firmicutes bacterium]|nr:hypothetical protein [Bacillota bacterium]